MRRLSVLIPALCLLVLMLPQTLMAQTVTVDTLMDRLRMQDLLDIMAEESVPHAEALEADLFPGGGGASWAQTAARIHDPDLNHAKLTDVIAGVMTPEALEDTVAFFGSDLGAKIIEAEIMTRRAFLDPAIEQAAEDLALDRMSDAPDRVQRIKAYMRINSLVQQNVAAGLNSSLALYRGLQEGGAYEGDLTNDMVLSEVMNSEPELRITTARWLEAYLGLAYDGLTDAEFDAFLAFSESAAGQVFNEAIFQGFGTLFEDQSYALGRAAARYMQGSEL